MAHSPQTPEIAERSLQPSGHEASLAQDSHGLPSGTERSQSPLSPALSPCEVLVLTVLRGQWPQAPHAPVRHEPLESSAVRWGPVQML